MQKKQKDLVNPVFIKVGKAIEEVALENGYSYIINPQMIGGGEPTIIYKEAISLQIFGQSFVNVLTCLHAIS